MARDRREEVKKELRETTPTSMFYERMANTDSESLRMGNVSHSSSKGVLKKISSEITHAEGLHYNVHLDVLITRDVLRSVDMESKLFKGYIQTVSVVPFWVHMFTEKQIDIAVNNIHRGNCILHLDATGSVVHKIKDPLENDSKSIYYYALVVNGERTGEPPLPVAEMISACQTTVAIATFLMTFKHAMVKRGCRISHPSRREVDYSWALIHSCLLVFGHCNIRDYLSFCWNIFSGNNPIQYEEHFFVHICAAHVIKRVSDKVSKLVDSKELKLFILRVFALLQNYTVMDDTTETWTELCTVLSAHSADQCKNELHALSVKMAGVEDVSVASDINYCSTESQTTGAVHITLQESLPIRDSSDFYKHFSGILDSTKEKPANTKCNMKENPFHVPAVLEYLLNNYMHIYPLWSGLCLNINNAAKETHKTRDTNCHVENWMRILKHDIMQKKKHSAGVFLKKLQSNLVGMVLTYSLDISKFVQKRKRSEPGIEESEERWAKKPKKGISYYSTPGKIPLPRSQKRKTPSKKACEHHTKSAKQLKFRTTSVKHADKKFQFAERKNGDVSLRPGMENTSLTCWLNSCVQSIAELQLPQTETGNFHIICKDSSLCVITLCTVKLFRNC